MGDDHTVVPLEERKHQAKLRQIESAVLRQEFVYELELRATEAEAKLQQTQVQLEEALKRVQQLEAHEPVGRLMISTSRNTSADSSAAASPAPSPSVDRCGASRVNWAHDEPPYELGSKHSSRLDSDSVLSQLELQLISAEQSLEKDKCKRAIMEEQIQAVQADAIESRVSSRASKATGVSVEESPSGGLSVVLSGGLTSATRMRCLTSPQGTRCMQCAELTEELEALQHNHALLEARLAAAELSTVSSEDLEQPQGPTTPFARSGWNLFGRCMSSAQKASKDEQYKHI